MIRVLLPPDVQDELSTGSINVAVDSWMQLHAGLVGIEEQPLDVFHLDPRGASPLTDDAHAHVFPAQGCAHDGAERHLLERHL